VIVSGSVAAMMNKSPSPFVPAGVASGMIPSSTE